MNKHSTNYFAWNQLMFDCTILISLFFSMMQVIRGPLIVVEQHPGLIGFDLNKGYIDSRPIQINYFEKIKLVSEP
jgi:hypothetical protein